MAIISWLNRNIHGDSNMFKDLRRFGHSGRELSDSGRGLADEGVDYQRKLGDAYEQMLKGDSSLSPQMRRAFDRARGLVGDRHVRDISSIKARLGQARVAGRGRLSHEALQEFMIEGESEANRAAHEAGVGIDLNEAQMEQTEANNLRDRLQRAREMILNAGEFRQQLGNQQQLAALLARLDKHKAIASTIMQGAMLGMNAGK